MTLFNRAVLHEIDIDEQELAGAGFNFNSQSGFSSAENSFASQMAGNSRKKTYGKTNRNQVANHGSQTTNIKTQDGKDLAAENRDLERAILELKSQQKRMPAWTDVKFFILLALIGLSWIIRLTIYFRSISANIFFRKVILR